MPTTDAGERRAAKAQLMVAMGPPAPQPQLPCPRCDSTNTKFCYYNNYNLSQPRHFCKGCRRYWTHGGTLRNVPVGGTTRKNSKRSRPAGHPTFSGSSSGGSAHDPRSAAAASPSSSSSSAPAPRLQTPAPIPSDASLNGSFTSLLNLQGGSPGFLALGGLGSGLEELGFGLGRGVWPYPEVGAVDGGSGGGEEMGGCGSGASDNGPVGWQLGGGGGEGGFGDADCSFPWPDLAISMSAKGFQ